MVETVQLHYMSRLMSNGRKVERAAKELENFINSSDVTHKTFVYVKQPDGTEIKLQKGCEIYTGEFTVNEKEDK